MLTKSEPVQNEMETVILEELVPADHLLRKIRKTIDFSFIYEKTKGLYCPDNGRPAIDPIKLFKILFIGYLFGIRSERQIIQEIQVNVAYRWFLGYNLTDKIPDASTISQNRRRRFNETDIAQNIFDEIVRQAIKHNLAEGKTLYTDSTHLKANANKNKFIKEEREISTKPYLEALDKAIEEDRERHGKNPLKTKKKLRN